MTKDYAINYVTNSKKQKNATTFTCQNQLTMSRISSLLKEKCPKCETGKVFKTKGNILTLKFPEMNKQCDHCSHTFEIEPGYFYGAMFVSYGLVVLEMFAFFLISLAFEMNLNMRLILVIVPMILLSIINFRYSRIIWMYVFTRKVDKK